MTGVFLAALLLLGLSVTPGPALAASSTPGRVIAGWVEKMTLRPWGLVVKAKLDTGAFTSSIDAENIERFERDGEKWVRFDLEVEIVEGETRRVTVERPFSRRVLIKQTEGERDPRIAVDLDFCFDGRRHTSEFTLADRTGLIYPVLLGRRFLQNRAVVDPSETFRTQAACDVPDPPADTDKPEG